ncbi:MAG: DUF4261 domain-containing protein [Synergistaceae bacterium]|jgi:hypothetical protein|nr:DUF4261 domain-containing protein [Synergistaceae bacterium]
MSQGGKGVLKQDLSQEVKYSGVYMISLLFREKAEDPPPEILLQKLKERFGGVDVVSKSDMRAFALTSHTVAYKEGQKAPSQVILVPCAPIKQPLGDAITRSQFWDCPDGAERIDSCPWQVMIGDFLARLPPLERGDVLANWLEVALSLFPTCEAVYPHASGKLLTAESARNNPYPGDPRRFVWFGVNARFFNVRGTEDSVVDTLGLYALGLPDVQYHFRGLDPGKVVRHAYNTAVYQFENGAPIQAGESIEGIEPGSSWLCQYERALIQPVRDVLDIAPGEHAADKR